ncbi:Protein C54D10.5 [Aphelenchoides avenae]|nr:Protein C54D10.5 [Aphelenchus avenae]
MLQANSTVTMVLLLPDGGTELIEGDEDEQLCGDYEEYTTARFVFLLSASCIAFLGTFANIFLAYLFATRKYPNTPPTLYPGVLALLDAIICAVYILLFGADAVIFFARVKSLFLIYHVYIVPAFVLSRIAQIAIPYMLIFATLERFVWIAGNMRNSMLKHMYSIRGRCITVAFSLAICIALRLPAAWATIVYEYPNCPDFFRSQTASAAPWVRESLIYHVYDFHLLSIAQTFIPFVVLFVFNVIIVRRLSTTKFDADQAQRSLSTASASEHMVRKLSAYTPERSLSVATAQFDAHSLMSTKSVSRRMNGAVKSAIYTMVAIVTSYLLCNTLHLFLTVLER